MCVKNKGSYVLMVMTLLLFAASNVLSQEEESEVNRNLIFFEIGGNAIIYSLNYERLFPFENNKPLIIRTGLEYLNFSLYQENSFKCRLNDICLNCGHDEYCPTLGDYHIIGFPVAGAKTFPLSKEKQRSVEVGVGFTFYSIKYRGEGYFQGYFDGSEAYYKDILINLCPGIVYRKQKKSFLLKLGLTPSFPLYNKRDYYKNGNYEFSTTTMHYVAIPNISISLGKMF